MKMSLINNRRWRFARKFNFYRCLKVLSIYCLASIVLIVTFELLFHNEIISFNSSALSLLNLYKKFHNLISGRQRTSFFVQNIILLSTLVRSSSDDCQWRFHHYSPSSWEAFWYNNISNLQNHVCATLAQTDQINKSITALEYIINLQKTIFNHSSLINQSDELLSKIHYEYRCSHSSLVVSQSIEPLIGLLRDPLTVCRYKNFPSSLAIHGTIGLQSKRFFLLAPSAPFHNFHSPIVSIPPWLYRDGAQKILFDIGSSYFNGIENGTSSVVIGTRWFYEYFRSLSLRFDRIVAFEAVQYSSQAYWNQIPADMIGALSFINVGVEKTGKLNPWNILTSIAKEDDYVTVKLDIDQPKLENELINQILQNRSISSLIDEMFFEMHVRVAEMIPFWGNQPGQLKDSYILFTKLRELGIRMHSWP